MDLKRMSARASRSLSDCAVATLREEILSGAVAPGTRLSEAPVARRLGVSRVPVREALVTLESEGLVEFRATGRAFVKKLSVRDFGELYGLRLLLEPPAARLAAPHVRQHLARFEENIEATLAARTEQELTKLDLDFHELILMASGNSRLLRAWRSFRNELQLWLGSLHHLQNQRSDALRETVALHRDLLSHFLKSPPAQCERILREHILVWREWLPIEES